MPKGGEILYQMAPVLIYGEGLPQPAILSLASVWFGFNSTALLRELVTATLGSQRRACK
jgi:hypothetical protein